MGIYFCCLPPAGFLINSLYLWSGYNNKPVWPYILYTGNGTSLAVRRRAYGGLELLWMNKQQWFRQNKLKTLCDKTSENLPAQPFPSTIQCLSAHCLSFWFICPSCSCLRYKPTLWIWLAESQILQIKKRSYKLWLVWGEEKQVLFCVLLVAGNKSRPVV